MSTRVILIFCVFLALLGWSTLGYFTYYNPPDALNRWIALAMLWPTLVATFLPLIYAFHLRRSRNGEVTSRAARQSVLVATFFTLCVWLLIMRALNWANAILMLLLFILTEALLSARENPS